MIIIEFFVSTDTINCLSSIRTKNSFPVGLHGEKYQKIVDADNLFFLKVFPTDSIYENYDYTVGNRYFFLAPVEVSENGKISAIPFNVYKERRFKNPTKYAVLNHNDRLKYNHWIREQKSCKYDCFKFESLECLWDNANSMIK